MTRADMLLVARGLAPTRSAAQRLIEHGAVRWRDAPVRKAGLDLPEDAQLVVTDDAEVRWASRGGLKLDAALERTGIRVQDKRCLDLGQSTGGFTDVLLARGAREVVGVDVGHGQLHPRLAADPRVLLLEGLDARAYSNPERYDLVVGDLSFISQTLVLATLRAALAPGADALMLVKPQFELQPADIGKSGLVKDPSAYPRVERRIRAAYALAGLTVCDYFESPIHGGEGNREFFVHAAYTEPPR